MGKLEDLIDNREGYIEQIARFPWKKLEKNLDLIRLQLEMAVGKRLTYEIQCLREQVDQYEKARVRKYQETNERNIRLAEKEKARRCQQ